MNEGDVEVGGFPPYPIAYKSIVPKQSQCVNLLVPVCMSATHISYGSIRMEPVFMVLGQSAATAACQAIEQNAYVQQIDMAKLRERLLADKQVLEWTGPRPPAALVLSKLAGICVDDAKAELTGDWSSGRSIAPFVESGYLHDANEGQGQKSARFTPDLPKAGRYEVRIIYSANANRATNVPITIQSADGTKTVQVNQRKPPSIDKTYQPLGTFRFEAGQRGSVTISNAGADGHVIVDTVQFLPVD